MTNQSNKNLSPIEQAHQCEKSQNKIVCVSLDHFGVMRCGYCHQVVNYKPYIDHFVSKLGRFTANKKGMKV